jgi:hypothetical protein
VGAVYAWLKIVGLLAREPLSVEKLAELLELHLSMRRGV